MITDSTTTEDLIATFSNARPLGEMSFEQGCAVLDAIEMFNNRTGRGKFGVWQEYSASSHIAPFVPTADLYDDRFAHGLVCDKLAQDVVTWTCRQLADGLHPFAAWIVIDRATRVAWVECCPLKDLRVQHPRNAREAAEFPSSSRGTVCAHVVLRLGATWHELHDNVLEAYHAAKDLLDQVADLHATAGAVGLRTSSLAKPTRQEDASPGSRPCPKICVTRRNGDFHACLADQPAIWGCGPSSDAAIGNLVRGHAEEFSVEILVDAHGPSIYNANEIDLPAAVPTEPAKIVARVTNTVGRPFNVVLVCSGDHYGLHDKLTHDGAEPLVEFWDATYEDDPRFTSGRGQLVSRYYLSTLTTLTGKGSARRTPLPTVTGLALCGHEPAWRVTGENVATVIAAVEAALRGDDPAKTAREEQAP